MKNNAPRNFIFNCRRPLPVLLLGVVVPHAQVNADAQLGDNAADTLLTVLAEKHRFENQRQFIAYLGLDPKQFKSGTSVKGRERISKVGSSRLRTALYMPAMHAYRSRTFAPFVSRLQANGKRPKQIIVALMRKLAVIAYNLIKTGKDFEPQRYISQNQ